MNIDQATTLRQLARQRTPLGGAAGPGAPLVVVGGGAPGVGTTTAAVNLAVALARQGRRTVLVDADLERGGRMRFQTQRDSGNVIDVLAGRRGVHEVLTRGPAGVQFLMGAAAANDAAAYSATAQDRFIMQLRLLAPHADMVVLDAGNSRSPVARRYWQGADVVWTVTRPDDDSILACYGNIKSMLAQDVSLTLQTFVNETATEAIAADVHRRLAEACHRFLGVAATSAGSIPHVDVNAATSEGCFAPGSPEARAFDVAADALWAQLLQVRSQADPRSATKQFAS